MSTAPPNFTAPEADASPSNEVLLTHPDYDIAVPQWKRSRDTYDGTDAIKKGRTLYLPSLESMDMNSVEGQAAYDGYLYRATFYGAAARTVDGLAGAVFTKPVEYKDVDEKSAETLEDVSMTAVPANLFMHLTTREVLKVGRAGVLVDFTREAKGRPYWVPYLAENITNWDITRINDVPVLTMVIVKEWRPKVDAGRYDTRLQLHYRTLTLEDGVYKQRLYTQGKKGRWTQVGSDIVPMRRGKALDFIPFVFFGPTTTESTVEKPPLLDLTDVNLSHYLTTASLEHGNHFCGTPQLVLIGGLSNKGEPVKFGSGRALLLPKDSDAKILQADGNLLGSLENAEKRKRDLMATLGARLLEAPSKVEETATAIAVRHGGETATLRTVASSIERGFTYVIRTTLWWMSTQTKPEDVKASVTLNKDYQAQKMSSEELKSWVLASQSGDISHETFWLALDRGGVARPGVTSEEELEQIAKETPEDEGIMPNAADPNADPSLAPGAAFKVVTKDGKFLVTDASGKVVPKGDHGTDQAGAKRHRESLTKQKGGQA